MPIVPTRETKLWEETATARTMGIPNNEGVRHQPPLGEVGGGKLWSHFNWTPLNWTRSGQKPSDSNQGQQCIMVPAGRPNSTEFKRVTHFLRHGLIMYAVRIIIILSCTHYSSYLKQLEKDWLISEDIDCIWIIVVLWRGGFSPFVAQRPFWRNHCSQGVQSILTKMVFEKRRKATRKLPSNSKQNGTVT